MCSSHTKISLFLLIFLAVVHFANGSSLTNLLDVIDMRRRATNVTRVNNLDIITTTNEQGRNETIAICHLVAMIPYSIATKGNNTLQAVVSINSSIEFTAAFALAIQHLNTGDGSVISEVEGLHNRCNVRFTPELIDSRASASHTVDRMIGVISRASSPEEQQRPCSFLGPTESAKAIAMAIFSGLKGIPQFSAQATSTELDDKETFPLFGRLIPADDGTALPLLELLVNQFDVRHFGVIHQNDAYGNKYMTSIRAAARLYPNTTVVAIDVPTWATSEDFERAVSILRGTKFRYFFAILTDSKYEPLMKEAFQQGIAGTGDHTWIYADGISTSTVTSPEYDRESPLFLASLGLSRLAAVGGFEGVSPVYDKYLEAFKSLANKQDIEILQSIQPMYPERITESILSSPMSSSFSILYDTVIALGLAACNASARLDSNFTGKDHYDTVLGMNFVGTSGNIVLNAKTGTRDATSARFVLTNFVEDKTTSSNSRSSNGKVKLTSFVSKYFEGDTWIDMKPFIFNDGTTVAPRSLPEVELNSNYIGTGLRAFGLTLSACVLLCSLGWALWTYKFREQRVVRASQPIFLQIICFGTFLLGSSIIPLSIDDEHSSTRGCDIACMAFPWLSSCGFCIAFSALFTKTHRINMIFKQANFKRIKVTPTDVMVPMVALLGVNVLVLSLWTGLSPFQWERETLSQDEFGQPTESRGFCTSDHSVYYYSVLAVIDLGALVYALYETYLARNLSTEFAESAYIAKALGLIVAVSLLGIPIAIIASDDPRSKFVALTGIIVAVCMSLLLFIFVPKELYRRKPNKNTMSNLVGANIGIKRDQSGLEVVDNQAIQEDLKRQVAALESKVRELEQSQKQHIPQTAHAASSELPQERASDNGAIESCDTEEDKREVPT